jgi:hypothetical protein
MAFVQLGAVPAVEVFRAEIKSITERSDGEKMALLILRRGNDLAKACLAIAVTVGWPQPSKADWRSLIADRLVMRGELTGFLVLTSTGLMQQQRLAVAMARVSSLHFLLPSGGDRYNVYCHCTCGWTASLSRNQGYLVTGQWAAFTAHMDAVAKGIWKRPRSVEETVAGICSPTVPSDRPPGDPTVAPETLPSPETILARSS